MYLVAAKLSDLAPLANLQSLQTLDCSSTQVSSLDALKHVPSLQSLDCSSTQVGSLDALKHVPSLQSLNCSRCRLTHAPDALWSRPSLRELYLFDTLVPGVPREVLSETEYDDCLDSLRAHLADLAAGREHIGDAKLLVLGNGRIGKTQLSRRLRNEDYQADADSTHGIVITSASLPRSDAHAITRLNIWDFGGQDIYHGTHALFMRSRALFAVVWAPEFENSEEYHHRGMVFRNQPLAYWLDYVRAFGGSGSPVLIVQTRCDTPANERPRPPASDEALNAFGYRKLLHYSAATEPPRGHGVLVESLREAAAWLQQQQGIAEIGRGRALVKREIEMLRDRDAARQLEQREHRTIGYADFLTLCDKAGGITEPKQLLAYLNNAGTVFYREGLFGDRVIIDQGWALEPIYAVFHRDKCYRLLQKLHGRFTRADLAAWIWDEAGYTADEQKLFLSMMRSCGICFVHREAQAGRDAETEYIAPDLLPVEIPPDVAQKWDDDQASESATIDYPLLPPTLMRAIVARIGKAAGLDADYWRNGVYVYETSTGSRALIEQETTDGWLGRIRIRTQRGQAGELLQRLQELVQEEQQSIGLAGAAMAAEPQRATRSERHAAAGSKPVPEADAAERSAPALQFGPERSTASQYFVSYAWGDRSKEGRQRERIVDQLCTAAEARGITIIRDKNTLGLGERISRFMKRLGEGDRIFVILSDKYLKSPYCMCELMEIWRNCRENEDELLQRVRLCVLPDARIRTLIERSDYAIHWRQQYDALEVRIKQHGADILGERGLQQHRLMRRFALQVGDLLDIFADTLLPRTLDDLVKYGLADLPAGNEDEEDP